MIAQSCKTCRWLAVPLDSAGRRQVGENNTYRCEYAVELPTLPVSITGVRGYRDELLREFMFGSEGTSCPCWEALP